MRELLVTIQDDVGQWQVVYAGRAVRVCVAMDGAATVTPTVGAGLTVAVMQATERYAAYASHSQMLGGS